MAGAPNANPIHEETVKCFDCGAVVPIQDCQSTPDGWYCSGCQAKDEEWDGEGDEDDEPNGAEEGSKEIKLVVSMEKTHESHDAELQLLFSHLHRHGAMAGDSADIGDLGVDDEEVAAAATALGITITQDDKIRHVVRRLRAKYGANLPEPVPETNDDKEEVPETDKEEEDGVPVANGWANLFRDN